MRDLPIEENENSKMHQRGSSPLTEVEKIYRTWLKRVHSPKDGEENHEANETIKPKTESPGNIKDRWRDDGGEGG